MITQEDKDAWLIQTKFMIFDTEIEDNLFREKHQCTCKDRTGEGTRYFCSALIRARRKNKPLMDRWMKNLEDSPYIKNIGGEK